MLEPLFRCNLKCKGCGKIDYPAETLKKMMSVQECIEAVEDCGAPVVSIAGGEPLLHPQIAAIIRELTAPQKSLFICAPIRCLWRNGSRNLNPHLI